MRQWVAEINEQFDFGCDGVILHGASPTDLGPIVDACTAQRDADRFTNMTANPGGFA